MIQYTMQSATSKLKFKFNIRQALESGFKARLDGTAVGEAGYAGISAVHRWHMNETNRVSMIIVLL